MFKIAVNSLPKYLLDLATGDGRLRLSTIHQVLLKMTLMRVVTKYPYKYVPQADSMTSQSHATFRERSPEFAFLFLPE